MTGIWALIGIYLRRVFPWALLTISSVIAGPWVLGQMLNIPNLVTSPGLVRLDLYFSVVGIACVFYGASAWVPLVDLVGKSGAKTLPLPNRDVANLLWLVPAGVIMVCNAVAQSGFRIVFDVPWPIFTTIICSGAFSMLCFSGAFWLRDLRWRQLVVAAIVVVGWILWFASRFYPNGFSQPFVNWMVPSAVDGCVLAVTVIGSWFLCQSAFASYRCGEGGPDWFQEKVDDLLTHKGDDVAKPALMSPQQALLEMDCLRSRHVGLWSGRAVGVLLPLCCIPLLSASNGDISKGLSAMSLMLCGMCGAVVGIWTTGERLWSKNRLKMRPFYSALPFSDGQLARVALRSSGTSLLRAMVPISGCLVVVVVVLAVAGHDLNLSFLFSQQPHLHDPGSLSVVIVVAAPLAIGWILLGLAITLASTGRSWPGIAAYIAYPGVVFVSLTVEAIGVSNAGVISDSLVIGLAALNAVATILLFAIAWRRHMISNRMVAICAAACGALAIFVSTFVFNTFFARFCGMCACTLVVLPFASLPFAIAWNRHR